MRTGRLSVVVLLLLLVFAGLPLIMAGGQGSAAAGTSAMWEPASPEQVARLGSLAFGEAAPAGLRTHAPSQADTVVIDEGFEDFPGDWTVTDLLEDEDPDNPHPTWGVAPCDRPPTPAGNTQAAWSSGGGIPVSCLEPYTTQLFTTLVSPPIDAREYSGGLELNLQWKLDMPDRERLSLCAFWAADAGACYNPSENGLANAADWADVSGLPFFDAANQEQVLLLFAYQHQPDEEDAGGPITGEHWGALLDNVEVVGIAEEPTPPPTLNIPTPEREPAPAYLPLSFMKAMVDDIPAQPGSESGFSVLVGTNTDRNGNVINRREVHQEGVMGLCQQVQWWGQLPGTEVRVQWRLDGEAVSEGNLEVNPEFTLDTEAGTTEGRCIQYAPDGIRQPIPGGTWQVEVYVGEAELPAASTQVVIQTDPPEGATPFPTQPAATATPVATPETGCREVLINGDFEAGPYQGWSVGSNLSDPGADDISKVISNKLPTRTGESEWAAWLWAGPSSNPSAQNAVHTLLQLVQLYDPATVDSATLTLFFGMSTPEQRDGEHDDQILTGFVNPQNNEQVTLIGGASEETVDPNTWYRLQETETTTTAMQASPGWTQSIFLIQSAQDFDEFSTFLIDDVSLEVCLSSANPLLRHLESGLGDLPGLSFDRPVFGDAGRVLGTGTSIEAVPDRPFPKTGGSPIVVEPAN